MSLALVALVLAGCGSVPPEDEGDPRKPDGGLAEVQYDLRDGRTVTCLVSGTAGLMSCDWDHAE